MGAMKEIYTTIMLEIQEAGYDEDRTEAFIAYLNNDHIPLEAWSEYTDEFEDAYCGKFDSRTDFTNDYIDQTGLLEPSQYKAEYSIETLIRYFDVDYFGRDLMLDHWETDGHYFRSN